MAIGSPIILTMNASFFFRKPAFFFLGCGRSTLATKCGNMRHAWHVLGHMQCLRDLDSGSLQLRLLAPSNSATKLVSSFKTVGHSSAWTGDGHMDEAHRYFLPGVFKQGPAWAYASSYLRSPSPKKHMPCLPTVCHDLRDEQYDRWGKLLHRGLVNGLGPKAWLQGFGSLKGDMNRWQDSVTSSRTWCALGSFLPCAAAGPYALKACGPWFPTCTKQEAYHGIPWHTMRLHYSRLYNPYKRAPRAKAPKAAPRYHDRRSEGSFPGKLPRPGFGPHRL